MSGLLDEIGAHVASRSGESYYVGGCVRDLLLGAPIKDVDFVVEADPRATGEALRKRYGGHFFWLREEDEVARVLLPEAAGGEDLQIDVTRLRGSIRDDLLARDLTINAMALPARTGLKADAGLLDPSGGRDDLRARLVRFVLADAPERDPLRTLRALRFRWKLDFRLAEGTAERIRECVPLLVRVSSERVRDELFQLLALPQAADALEECLGFGMLPRLVGGAVDLPDARPADRLRAVAQRVGAGPPELSALLAARPTPPRRRREILLWAAALQPLQADVDHGAAVRALALSNDERQIIVKGLAGAGRAAELVSQWPAAGSQRLRFFQSAGPAKAEAVLLSSPGAEWTPAHAELLDEALRRHFHPEPPLLSGIEIMQALHLSPGPVVGELLQAVEEARADGLARTPVEALEWLHRKQAGV